MTTMAINIKVKTRRKIKLFLIFKHRGLFPRFIKIIDDKNIYINVWNINVLKILPSTNTQCILCYFYRMVKQLLHT